MKTDFSKLPREEIEARITTMLMGEMSANEARELMDFVSGDAELLRLHDELKATISLVAEVSSATEQPKLSEGRREALLQMFKTVTATGLQKAETSNRNWAQWAAMAAMVGLLLGGTVFVFQSATPTRHMRLAARDAEESETQNTVLGEGGRVTVSGQVDAKALADASERGRAQTQSEDASRRKVGRQSDSLQKNLAQSRDGAAQMKIELPSSSAADADARADNNWGFRGEQLRRNFGDPNDNGVAPAGVQAPTLGYKAPEGSVEAKNDGANLSRGFLAAAPDTSRINPLTGLPITAGKDVVAQNEPQKISLGDSPKIGAIFEGQTGEKKVQDKPAASAPSARPFFSFGGGSRPTTQPMERGLQGAAEADGKKVAEGAAAGQMGMGGGAMMSMQYYMSNPELMKRYFPQMYQMMARGQTNGGSFGGVGGGSAFPGAPGLATTDGSNAATQPQSPPMAMTMPRGFVGGGMDRYRMPMQSPAASRPIQNKPEQQVALGVRQEDLAAGEAVRATPHVIQARRDAEELAKLKENRSLVEERLQQERADVAKAQPEVADRAEAGSENKKSFLDRLMGRGEERVARVEITKDATDITPLMPIERAGSYDPYFVQNEIEKIRSQKTLAEVVDTLKLDQKWGAAEGRTVSRGEAIERLKKSVTVEQQRNTGLTAIHARGDNPSEAAQIANTVAEVYQTEKLARKKAASESGITALSKQLAEQDKQIAQKEAELARLRETEPPIAKKPIANASIPQPEVLTAENAFSTFSLNVSDVSFKLAAASLEKGLMPDSGTVRSEEFINAFDYRDPEPQGAPVGFVWERARYPFAQDRDLVRFSVKTAASGREAGRPLNLVLLLDSSGSMERADRVRILQECLKTLAAQLRPEDTVSVVAFARTARLWVDGLPGSQASELPQRVGNLTPEGGTNLEEAMKVAYETARKHFNAGGVNRVVLLTDGAANLGDVEPESLKRKVEEERKRGVALDCFGIGWEGLNDELLETMSRNGDGRYGFVNTPEAAASEFAGQLAGALHVAASDVKVQVEWNPKRVTAYRQIGYAKHQLTKEQFRDNTVDAAELGAEAGNALYVVQVSAAGEGPLGTVRVRFKVPGTNDYREHAWTVDYDGAAKGLENTDYAMRLAGTASAFSEWLVSSPYASEVTTDRLLSILSGVPEHFAPDPRPKKLEWMIRQAKSLTGK